MKPTNKIAVIDDDTIILKITSATLEREGLIADCYNDPTQALQQITEASRFPDQKHAAIILDRIMPQMDGNDLLSKLQEDEYTRDIPVMMMTSKDNVVDITASLGLGARDYIVKPFDIDNFLIRLKKIMGSL